MARVSTIIAIVLVVGAAATIAILLAGLSRLEQTVHGTVQDEDEELSKILTELSFKFHPVHWLVLMVTGATVILFTTFFTPSISFTELSTPLLAFSSAVWPVSVTTPSATV